MRLRTAVASDGVIQAAVALPVRSRNTAPERGAIRCFAITACRRLIVLGVCRGVSRMVFMGAGGCRLRLGGAVARRRIRCRRRALTCGRLRWIASGCLPARRQRQQRQTDSKSYRICISQGHANLQLKKERSVRPARQIERHAPASQPLQIVLLAKRSAAGLGLVTPARAAVFCGRPPIDVCNRGFDRDPIVHLCSPVGGWRQRIVGRIRHR